MYVRFIFLCTADPNQTRVENQLLPPLMEPESSRQPQPQPKPKPQQQHLPPSRPRRLYKQLSWSPDTTREEVWQRRKGNYTGGRKCRKCTTDDDVEELKACVELGFGFGTDLDPKLSDTLPALGFYCAVNKQYSESLLRRTSSATSHRCENDNASASSSALFDPGDDPEIVKTRLKQWAQMVACSVRQISGKPR